MSRYRTRSWRSFDPSRLVPAAAQPAPPAGTVRILGLDPGSRRTGFGVVEYRDGRCSHVIHGCLNVAGAPFVERLRSIFEGLQRLVSEHAPGEIAIERVFVSRSADSALKLGHARGAALCALPAGLPVFEYAPRAVKLAVVGSGAAEKGQVAHMVGALLGLAGRLPPDAADALAIALCHAHSRRMRALLAAASSPASAPGAAPQRPRVRT